MNSITYELTYLPTSETFEFIFAKILLFLCFHIFFNFWDGE